MLEGLREHDKELVVCYKSSLVSLKKHKRKESQQADQKRGSLEVKLGGMTFNKMSTTAKPILLILLTYFHSNT